MKLTFLFIATVSYCCQNTCWALKKNEDAAPLQRSKYDFIQNMIDGGINRISASRKTSGKNSVRKDYRCGPKFLAPNGRPAQCKHANCCSNKGWCGDTDLYCKCKGCINFKVSECGVVKKKGNRIVGGKEVVAHQYPWMATILHRSYPKQAWCGGSLISRRWILTAAHCFNFTLKAPVLTIEEATVLLGHQNVISLSTYMSMEHRPRRLIRHNDFRPTDYIDIESFAAYANDIALVELETPVEISETISPVCLPTTDELYLHTSVTVIGYGGLGNGKSSSKLMEVDLLTISNNRCKTIGEKYKGIMANTLCALNMGKDSCEGDSGGPLMTLEENKYKYVQIGIVSVGPRNCGERGKAGVYTRVSKYLNWIRSNTNGEI